MLLILSRPQFLHCKLKKLTTRPFRGLAILMYSDFVKMTLGAITRKRQMVYSAAGPLSSWPYLSYFWSVFLDSYPFLTQLILSGSFIYLYHQNIYLRFQPNPLFGLSLDISLKDIPCMLGPLFFTQPSLASGSFFPHGPGGHNILRQLFLVLSL